MNGMDGKGMMRSVWWILGCCLFGGWLVACQKVELPTEEEKTEQAEGNKPSDEDDKPQIGGEDDGDTESDGEEEGDNPEEEGPELPEPSHQPGYEGRLSVTELLSIYSRVNIDSTEYDAQVAGYIVGVCDRSMENACFSPELIEASGVRSNILLADDREERNIGYCLPVELKSGTELRDRVNLIDNPEMQGRKILVIGVVQTYFGQIGLKKLNAYFDVAPVEPDGEPDDEPTQPEEPDDKPEIPDEPDDDPDDEPSQPDVSDDEQEVEVKDTLVIDSKPTVIPGGRSTEWR